jgi:molybdate transport system substrate-binding protein
MCSCSSVDRWPVFTCMERDRGIVAITKRKSYIYRLMILHRLAIFLLILIATNAIGAELHVSAPRTMKATLTEISELFEKHNPEWKVKLRTGKSGDLGRLISQGTSTDVFLLSDEKTVRTLRQKKKSQNIKRFLADDFIVIGSENSKLAITDVTKLSFPELKGVALYAEKSPVGKRSRAYLKKANLLDPLLPKISEKKNTKELVSSLSSGAADWGIVYASDIANLKGVKVLWKIPEADIPPDVYYVGSVTKSKNQEGARLFMEALNSTIALKLFENAGLRVLKN